ncbi:MAG: nucleotide exchange factor GrpE [Clostridia bacterium]|nr:nucleotide exchange factor GrpE [Clostridia bacterium]
METIDNVNPMDEPAPEDMPELVETADDGASAPDAAIAALEAQRDEYLNMAQRIQAEFENYRRRTNAARSEAWEEGARETVALFLPVIDNIERALSAEADKTPLRDGLELIYRQILGVLEKRGVTEINRLGEPFNPELESAMMQADVSEGVPGEVCEVLQKGYRTQTRVIRHAMVRVVAG